MKTRSRITGKRLMMAGITMLLCGTAATVFVVESRLNVVGTHVAGGRVPAEVAGVKCGRDGPVRLPSTIDDCVPAASPMKLEASHERAIANEWRAARGESVADSTERKQATHPDWQQQIRERVRAKAARLADSRHPSQKLEPILAALVQRVDTNLAMNANAQSLSIPGVAKVDERGRVQVYVETHGEPSDQAATLSAAGLEIELVVPETRQIQGWVAIGKAVEIASIETVRQVCLPGYGRRNAGGTTTQGDALLRANLVRTLPTPGPYTGAGVKVCIISDGCTNRATAVAAGDLPPSGITVHPTLQDPGDEGTGMAEIVHDLAPGAQLYAVGPSTSLEMIAGIRWAVEMGCQIICDDWLFTDQPFFEDGPVAVAAREAIVNNGVCFVSAVGNDAERHYQGIYSAITGGTHHDFNPGTGEDQAFEIHVNNGEWASLYLQWNDAFGASANDYDLYLIDPSTSEIVESSETGQSGTGTPLEVIHWQNTSGVGKTMHVVIDKYSGSAKTLELLVLGDATVTDDAVVLGDSIFGHPAVSEVISVGAIDCAAPGLATIDSYSCRGPSTVSFPSIQSRQTPSITALDWVSVSGVGGYPTVFGGTSAAAAHVAGISALLLSKNPNLSPAQVKTALTSTAVDKGVPGFDNDFGFGLVDALAAVNAVVDPSGGAEIAIAVSTGGSVVDAGTISFGNVNSGSTARIVFTIKNLGTSILSGLSITKDGSHSSNFTVGSLGATSVLPGEITTFDVVFAPSATGTRTAAIHVFSNDSDESPFDINLKGVNARLAWVGNTAGQSTWNRPVQNGSSIPTLLSGFATAVPYEAFRFRVGTSGSYTIKSIGNWDNYAFLFSTSFDPAVPLANIVRGNDQFPYIGTAGFTRTLTAGTTYILVTTGFDNPDAGSYSVEITGAGTVTGLDLPDIAVEQPSGTGLTNGVSALDYGAVVLGFSSTKTFTIRNTGAALLSGVVLTQDGTDAGDFIISTAPATTVVAGNNTSFTIQFTPTAIGNRSVAIRIASNDHDENPFVVRLTGKGDPPPAISVTAVSQEFGLIEVGTTAELTFSVANTGGGTLAGSVSVPAPFAVVSGGSYSLSAGATQIVTVRYSPTAAGTHTQNVSFTGGVGASRPVSGSAYVVIQLQSTSMSVEEGGSGSFMVWLSGQPESELTVSTARTNGDPDLTISAGASLTFTTGNWNLPQPVTITAVEDVDFSNGEATFSVSAPGLTSRAVEVTEVDDDESYAAWANRHSLDGSAALALSSPHGDGVENLLKYAFNLAGDRCDSRVLVPGGSAGLPIITSESAGPTGRVVRFEFLRRVSGGLIYTPLKSEMLGSGTWLPLNSKPTITPIEGGDWERVIHDEPIAPESTARSFGRVQIVIP